MSFVHPWVLFLLVLPAALVVWVWRREDRRIVMPFDHGRPSRGRLWAMVVHLAETIPMLVLATVIVLLAGPLALSEPKSQRRLTNIEFCVDISGSMMAPLGGGTRYDASMAAIDQFLDRRQGDAFGLTFFGNSVLHWVPLTNDASAIRCAPPFMRPEVVPYWYGGTEIGKALLECQKVLAERDVGDRMIVLVSDGYSADLFGGADEEIAAKLRASGIVVYGVHVADSEVPDPIVNITHLTGGEVFQAGDEAALESIFARIDQMQPIKLEKGIAETLDNFRPVCLVGLTLLSLGLVSLFGLRYTPW